MPKLFFQMTCAIAAVVVFYFSPLGRVVDHQFAKWSGASEASSASFVVHDTYSGGVPGCVPPSDSVGCAYPVLTVGGDAANPVNVMNFTWVPTKEEYANVTATIFLSSGNAVTAYGNTSNLVLNQTLDSGLAVTNVTINNFACSIRPMTGVWDCR